MLNRVLEPEVMNTSDEAHDYNEMDHSQVNRIFVDDFLTALDTVNKPSLTPVHIFDAGTGTALIPIELISRGRSFKITASDLADEMLIVAKQNVISRGYQNSIELVLRDCKKLPEADDTYDAIMSNSIVHHIPEPSLVIGELWRVLKPGGLCFIRDLMRPGDLGTLGKLVQTYAGYANAHQQQMFRESLHAALTLSEVGDLLKSFGIPSTAVQATSDRHWTICVRK